ncbi:GNAT family N-acetyltransferase [Jannaschia sp. KMU-145]|uniref:GNAT family N-acetyltransferase n=1 Tax=Jannaschia halovivens TaxID=3388667 RepID=UPI00396AFD08
MGWTGAIPQDGPSTLRRIPPGGNSARVSSQLSLVTTRDPDAVADALALRRAVFVDAGGAVSDADAFDHGAEHLILRDPARPEIGVVGTLRIGTGWAYTAREFDLSRLVASGRAMIEIGRTCLHPDYRGGLAGLKLLQGALDAATARGAELLVGTASFPGSDPTAHLDALRRLASDALAPEAIRPTAHGPGAIAVSGPAPRAAMRTVPPLIKTYLRAGARVGSGAYCDAAFGTTDICMVLDLADLRLPRGLRG